MKTISIIFRRIMTILAVAAFALACESDKDVTPTPTPEPEPEPEPEPVKEYVMTAELVSVGTSTADLSLTTKNITKYGYLVESKDADIAADIIFATGTTANCQDGTTAFTISGLKPTTNYTVLLAGITTEDEYYEKVLKVNLTTQGFSEELTFFDIDYTSVSCHFNFPHDKVKEGNALKWGICEFPVYYQNIMNLMTDAEMMNLHDTAWGPYIVLKDDVTWTFNEIESYLGKDPEVDETANALYSPIVPGQPMYLMIGEYAYQTEDHWGWGAGYYNALFDYESYWNNYRATGKLDDQTGYWSGYYRKEFVESKAPGVLNASPKVDMALTPRGGTITITPTDDIYAYCYAIVAPDLYLDIMPLLNNKPSYMQWYITSYHAFANGVSGTAFDATKLVLEDLFYVGMQQGAQYNLFITSLSDAEGSKQSFQKHSFVLPKPTKPAPTVTVTGINNPEGANTHDRVWFNIKCDSGDAYQVKYIANYEREWMALYNQYVKAGYSAADAHNAIIDQYGAVMNEAEIKLVNSSAGMDVSFDSRADATTVMGVRVMNDEGLVTVTTAMNRTIPEPAAPAVSSTLFDELKGVWTASTTIRYTHYHRKQNPAPGEESDYQITTDEPMSCKVIIGEVGYEETLPEEVYQFFFDATNMKTKEEVDAVYDQFKTTVDAFNENVRAQNRLLCQGFALEYDYDLLPCPSPDHRSDADGKWFTQYASPYDLFIADSDTYSAYNYESPVFDFGPKWYLQIGEGDTVTAPFNTNYFFPMSQWYEYVYHFVGMSSKFSLPYVLDEYSQPKTGHFPVTVSADRNTITINPLRYTYQYKKDDGTVATETDDFYPNIARAYNGSYQFGSFIVAPIVLTRGYSESAVTASATSKVSTISTVDPIYESKSVVMPKSRTALPTNDKVIVAPVEEHIKPLTSEQFKANVEKFNADRANRNK